MKKKTINDFLLEANKIHNNKYDYSKVEYINNSTKVKIICPIHGEFEQSPSKHICDKQGCPECGQIIGHSKQKKELDNFIIEANKIHKNKYDYSNVEYINNKTKIKIICPVHGEFKQTVTGHLSGKGCKYCGGTSKMDNKLFINKANEIHKNKYDYSLVEYQDSHTNIKIICPEHGIFEQTPNNHLSKKQGCYECLGEIFDTKSFIKICSHIHNNKYDYSLVNYTKITNNVKIICPVHGEFEQRCDSHRHGAGCLKCSNGGISKSELKIVEFISSLNLQYEIKNRTILNGKELDIYIPSHNLGIEYNGLYWHSEEFVNENYHLNKTTQCQSKGIQLIHIFEDEWIYKQDIVKSRLKNILGLTETKLYGRKCEIKEVNTKEAKLFLVNNHIQGNVNSGIRLGLYHNNELVSIMTFGKFRIALGNKNKNKNTNNQYELVRFCNKLDTTVIGGASKLLSYFIKHYSPSQIISYADRRWSQGGLYEQLGFKFIHDSKPNYFYIINKQREHRFKYRKSELIKQGYDPTKSECDIMLDRNIYRVYDCGTKKYQMSF